MLRLGQGEEEQRKRGRLSFGKKLREEEGYDANIGTEERPDKKRRKERDRGRDNQSNAAGRGQGKNKAAGQALKYQMEGGEPANIKHTKDVDKQKAWLGTEPK